jgi:hypothetical protein
MSAEQVTAAKARMKVLQRMLAGCAPLMRGSIVSNGSKAQPYFSLNKDGRTRLMYLGERRAEAAREMTGNYRLLLEIVEEMTVINMDLLKNDALD